MIQLIITPPAQWGGPHYLKIALKAIFSVAAEVLLARLKYPNYRY